MGFASKVFVESIVAYPILVQPFNFQRGEPKGAAMPLYSFHCAKCDGDVELLIGFSETPVCPACGSNG